MKLSEKFYHSENWDGLKTQISRLIENNFREIPLNLMEKAYPHLMEKDESLIVEPSGVFQTAYWFEDQTNMGQAGMLLDYIDRGHDALTDSPRKGTEFLSWLEENYWDDISDHWLESDNYPMWGTLFEFRSCPDHNEIAEMVYNNGMGLISETEELKPLIFFKSMGYDFYWDHWLPFFIDRGWIDPTDYPGLIEG